MVPPGGLHRASADSGEGASLHDIGKLNVSGGVLLKPGLLTAAERGLIRDHGLTDEALVRCIPAMPPEVPAVIRSHPERWDSAGYPGSLAGERDFLPRAHPRPGGRVRRPDPRPRAPPSHGARPVAGALALIRAESGRHFGPRVASAFLPLPTEQRPPG